MNAHYWVERALKEAAKNRHQAGLILLRYFQQAIEHTSKEAEEILAEKTAEIERLTAELNALKGTAPDAAAV